MSRHFGFLHLLDLDELPGKGSYPKCEQCRVLVNPAAMGQQSSKTYKEMHAAKLQPKAVSHSAKALEARFFAPGVELERVEVFTYLGRLIEYDGEDTQAVRGNLKKARRVWARISRVLRVENASPRVCGMFYKGTVQSMLLFGSETWCLTPPLP